MWGKHTKHAYKNAVMKSTVSYLDILSFLLLLLHWFDWEVTLMMTVKACGSSKLFPCEVLGKTHSGMTSSPIQPLILQPLPMRLSWIFLSFLQVWTLDNWWDTHMDLSAFNTQFSFHSVTLNLELGAWNSTSPTFKLRLLKSVGVGEGITQLSITEHYKSSEGSSGPGVCVSSLCRHSRSSTCPLFSHFNKNETTRPSLGSCRLFLFCSKSFNNSVSPNQQMLQTQMSTFTEKGN